MIAVGGGGKGLRRLGNGVVKLSEGGLKFFQGKFSQDASHGAVTGCSCFSKFKNCWSCVEWILVHRSISAMVERRAMSPGRTMARTVGKGWDTPCFRRCNPPELSRIHLKTFHFDVKLRL